MKEVVISPTITIVPRDTTESWPEFRPLGAQKTPEPALEGASRDNCTARQTLHGTFQEGDFPAVCEHRAAQKEDLPKQISGGRSLCGGQKFPGSAGRHSPGLGV